MQIKAIFQNRIFKNAVTLVSGTAIAQVVLIGFQLVLRRVFSPEVFGAYAVYMSIVGILVILSTLRYELAVVLPKEDRKANSIVSGGIFISLIINIILLICIVIFKESIVKLFDFPIKYSSWLFLIPASTFLFSVYQFFNYWLTRNAAFRAISINKVFRRVFEGSTQTAIGALKIPAGLPLGDIVGNIANIISGYYQATKKGFTFKNVSLKKIKSSLKRYIDFPKYQALPAILNTTSMLLPIFFVNKFYSHTSAGYFDLSRQILAVPIAFITASLSQVLLKELSDRIKKKQPITPNLLKTSLFLTAGIIPFVIIIVFWGSELFGFFFSKTWTESGHYSAILVPAFAIQFIISPLSISFTVLEKLKVLAIWQISYFAMVISMIFFKFLNVSDFLLLYTGINLFMYLIYFMLILSISKKYDNSLSQ